MATKDQLHEAYEIGYQEAEGNYTYKQIKKEMRDYAEEHGEDQAVHDIWMNGPCHSDRVHEGSCGEAQDLGDDSQGDREDLDSAFDAGALDAVLDREYDPNRVDHLAT